MGAVGFSNPPESISVSVGKNTESVIKVLNNGSVPVHDISVSERSNCEGLELSLSPKVVTVLEGGQSADFTLSLTANYTVKPGNYQIELLMNSTEGLTDSFSSALVVSVGTASQTAPEEQPMVAGEESAPEPGEKTERRGTIADTIKEVQSKSIGPETAEEKPVEAGVEAEAPSIAPAQEPAPVAESGPSVLTPAEVPKYEASAEKKPISERLNLKTLFIILAVVLVGMILIMDMANFVDLGIF